MQSSKQKRSMKEIKRGNLNPFDQPKIILCSFQFTRTKEAYIRQTPWDLVVIDEAHRLRNVYKASNKIANAIKGAIADRPKTLLTATPLQNSLELYGLVSIIDDFTFGDLRSFRSQFSRMNTQDGYRALRERIRPSANEPFADRFCRTSATPTATRWFRNSFPTTTNRSFTRWCRNTCNRLAYTRCQRASGN